MTREDYLRRFSPEDAPGRDALDAHLAGLLGAPGRHLPLPAARKLRAALDPEAPAEVIEGVSIWAQPASAAGPAHLLYVGQGCSDLGYDPERAGAEVSGMGVEPCLRLALADPDPATAPTWPAELMSQLARHALSEPRTLSPGFLAMLGEPLAPGGEVSALLMVPDPELDVAETPHGEVGFLLALGVTDAEAEALAARRLTPEALLTALEAAGAAQVTDPERRGSVL